MANPQLEDGYFKISNEYWDARIKIRIPGEASQVLDFIIRKTWGWGKKEDYISLSQFVSATGISRNNVIRAREILISMNLIVVSKNNGGLTKYKVNKYFNTWKPIPKSKRGSLKKETWESQKRDVSKKRIGVSQKRELGESQKRDIQKTLLQNTIYKRKESGKAEEEEIDLEPIDEELTELLLSQILKEHPKWKLIKPSEQKKARKDWPQVFARLRKIDFRSVDEIREIITWSTEHEFWTTNIRSAESIRRNWDSIQAQMEKDSKKLENLSDEAVARLVLENLKQRRGRK